MLETDRLLLREFTLDDAEAYLHMFSDPQMTRFTGGNLGVTTLEAARASLRDRPLADYRKHGFGRLACVCKDSGLVIGFAGLKFLDDLQDVDIGYRLLPAYWGKGLATEACRPVLRQGFEEFNLPHILGLVDPANTASVRVLVKLGFGYLEAIPYHGTTAAKYLLQRGQ
jgi:RimJ/RimL family protein N-acetyltransferase